MPVQGREIRTVAITLLADPNHGEACERAAIGRLYYAAFINARDFFKPWIPRGNTHKELPNVIENPQVGNNKVLAKQLRDLHELRKIADYDVQVSAHTILSR